MDVSGEWYDNNSTGAGKSFCFFFLCFVIWEFNKCFLSQLSFSSAEGINVKSKCVQFLFLSVQQQQKISLNSFLSWLVSDSVSSPDHHSHLLRSSSFSSLDTQCIFVGLRKNKFVHNENFRSPNKRKNVEHKKLKINYDKNSLSSLLLNECNLFTSLSRELDSIVMLQFSMLVLLQLFIIISFNSSIAVWLNTLKRHEALQWTWRKIRPLIMRKNEIGDLFRLQVCSIICSAGKII